MTFPGITIATLAATLAAPPHGDLDPEALGAFLDPIFAATMAAEHVPGAAIAIVHDGRIVFARGYGVAQIDGKPVDPENTLFRIGSVSKAVTALGIVRQIDRGLIGLDDDVNTHLKAIRVDDRYPQPVTFEHLLTHTGGFDQFGRDRNFTDATERPDLASFLRRDLRRIRPPGRTPCYDTYGISLAGYAAAERAGGDYATYMRREVFEPLGMSRTWVEVPDAHRGDLAIGYSWADGAYVEQEYEYYASLPASSIDSTVTDMARLMIAVLGDGSNAHGRLYGPAAAARVKQPQFRVHPEIPGFAWGFWEAFRYGRRLMTHGGTMRGYSCDLQLYPDDDLGVFVIASRDSETGPATRLAGMVCERLGERWFPGQTQPDPVPPGDPLPIDTARFAGRYAGNLYCHTCEGDGWPPPDYVPTFEAVGPGVLRSPTRRYYAVEPLLFKDETGRFILAFTEDAQGHIASMSFNLASPGNTSEKIGEQLMIEVLGPDWSEQASSLVGFYHRVHERWAEAAAIDAALADRADPGSPGEAFSRFRAGEYYARAGAVDPALRNLTRAREVAMKIAAEGGPLAQRASTIARRTFFFEIAAHSQAGDRDAAFALIDEVMERFGLPSGKIVEDLRESPLFANLLDDPRFDALAREGVDALAGFGWSLVNLDLEVDVRPGEDRILLGGRAVYRLELDSTDTLTLGVNSRGPWMEWDAVRTPGATTSALLNQTMPMLPPARMAVITSGQPWSRGDEVTVEFELHSTGEGMQFEISEEIAFASWVTVWYPAPLPDIAAGESLTSGLVAAPGTMRMIMPASWRAVTNGEMLDREVRGDRAMETWRVEDALARSYSVGAYKAGVYDTSGRKVGIYLLSDKPDSAEDQAQILADAVRVMAERFGPYPYQQFSIAEVPAWVDGFGASSEQGFIMTRPGFLAVPGGNLPLFAHEAAHGWFGNLVGTSGRGGHLLSEGLAQYGAVVAIEALEGPAAATTFLRFSRTGYVPSQCAEGYFRILREGRDAPISKMADGGGVNHTIVDAKGHWIFHMLRRRVSDEVFFSTVRALLDEHAGGEMSLDQWRAAFTAAAPDRELGKFFRQWLDQAGAPVLDLDYRANGDGTVTVEITQAQPGEAYHLELDLEITDDDGRAHRHTVTVRGPVSTFMLPARGVQSITMDPDHALLIWTPEYGPRPTIGQRGNGPS
ncbi:MAG: hypothetical protein E2O40_07320 [Planctomycetota bacterium]|nr:MAG: hypothetical protein E2O40_07320 [Planctomycetota bacterium]